MKTNRQDSRALARAPFLPLARPVSVETVAPVLAPIWKPDDFATVAGAFLDRHPLIAFAGPVLCVGVIVAILVLK